MLVYLHLDVARIRILGDVPMKCPATMCPYLGLEEKGSDWTGAHDSDCETECGWYDDYGDEDYGCMVAPELVGELVREHNDDTIPNGEWPACPHEDECQWQNQLDEGVPCPPRLAVMINVNPEVCLF